MSSEHSDLNPGPEIAGYFVHVSKCPHGREITRELLHHPPLDVQSHLQPRQAAQKLSTLGGHYVKQPCLKLRPPSPVEELLLFASPPDDAAGQGSDQSACRSDSFEQVNVNMAGLAARLHIVRERVDESVNAVRHTARSAQSRCSRRRLLARVPLFVDSGFRLKSLTGL